MVTIEKLKPTYEDRMDFLVHDLTTEAGRESSKTYDWDGAQHGLVTLKADGSQAALLPGHSYGADKIEEAIVRALR